MIEGAKNPRYLARRIRAPLRARTIGAGRSGGADDFGRKRPGPMTARSPRKGELALAHAVIPLRHRGRRATAVYNGVESASALAKKTGSVAAAQTYSHAPTK